MQGQSHLYILLTSDKKSLAIDSTGQIVTLSQPTPIKFSPDGWQDISIIQERNKTYHGFERTVTIPFNFVEDGAAILKHYYYRQGIENQVFLLILEQQIYFTETEYGFYYTTLFYGQPDYSTFRHRGAKVTCNIVDTGISKLAKANENTVYEIDLDMIVKHDGMVLNESGLFSFVDGLEIKKTLHGTNFFLPIFYVNSEGKSTGISFLTQTIENVSGLTFAQKLASTNNLFQLDESAQTYVSVLISGKISFTCTKNDPTLGFRVRILKSTMTLANQDDYELFSVVPAVGQTYEYTVNENITLFPGERLYVEGIYFGGITGAVDIVCKFNAGSNITAEYENRYKTTYIKAATVESVFKQLVTKITGGLYQGSSSHLAAHSDVVVSSGDAIRGIAGAKIKTSLKQFFQTVYVLFRSAMGVIDDKLVIEHWLYFMQGDSIDLGEVSDLEIRPATDYIYSSAKIGYPNSDTNDVNGRDDPFTTWQVTTPITVLNKELNLVSRQEKILLA